MLAARMGTLPGEFRAFEGEANRDIRRNRLPVECVAVRMNGAHAAARSSITHECLFFSILRLLANVRIAPGVIASEIGRRSLAAQVAIQALVGHVVFTRDVLRIPALKFD